MSEPREWKLEAHQGRFEPPDTLWLKLQGSISRETFVWTVTLCRELGSQQALFVVADVTETNGMDPEGRRYASEHMESEWIAAVIYIGARLIHKAAAKGIGFVVQHLLGRKTTPVYFVSNEEEARDVLAQLRRSKEPIPSQ